MNKQRRKELEALAEKVRELMGKIEDLKSEEEEYMDNMPESLQQSEKYYAAESAVDFMDSALTGLEDIAGQLEEAASV